MSQAMKFYFLSATGVMLLASPAIAYMARNLQKMQRSASNKRVP